MRTSSRLTGSAGRALVPALLAALLGACASTPGGGAHTLDPQTWPAELVAEAHRPASELDVEIVQQDGAVGGRIVFEVEGEPEEVLDMLLDFDHADGNRAWATQHETVSREGDVVTARWHLKGKAGISPVVQLAFVTQRLADKIRVTFDLVERTFAVSQLFGDYVIAEGENGSSLMSGRVFVASGLPFGGPTPDDIRDGMIRDVELIRGWMRERLLAR